MLEISKNRIAAVVLVLSVCHHAYGQDQRPQDVDKAPKEAESAIKKTDDKLKELGVTIGPGIRTNNGGYFATFEKQEPGWKLIDISIARPRIADFTRSEVLYFSDDLRLIQPDYRTYLHSKNSPNSFVCWTGALRTRKENAMTDYNPCESSLTTMADFHAVQQALFTVVTFGLYSATGTSSRTVVVDKEKVLTLVQQTDALERVREKKFVIERDRFLTAYRTMFVSAKTSSQFDAFIRRYSDNDPESLIPQAIARHGELSLSETEARKRRELEEASRREAQAKADAERLQYEQQQRSKQLASVESFRRSIKVEIETNCGPVLEIKGALVKIYSPVANYGNEHWIRKEQIFPPEFGCRFFNGNYQPPSL